MIPKPFRSTKSIENNEQEFQDTELVIRCSEQRMEWKVMGLIAGRARNVSPPKGPDQLWSIPTLEFDKHHRFHSWEQRVGVVRLGTRPHFVPRLSRVGTAFRTLFICLHAIHMDLTLTFSGIKHIIILVVRIRRFIQQFEHVF